MGLLDHRKTWHFSVEASDAQCFRAFYLAMSKTGFKLHAVRWSVEKDTVSVDQEGTTSPASVSTYEGRAGFAQIGTILVGKRAQEIEEGAMGSQITFTVKPKNSDGRTECSMWLSRSFSTFGFIYDASFFRSYMYDVEKNLRAIDQTLLTDKV